MNDGGEKSEGENFQGVTALLVHWQRDNVIPTLILVISGNGRGVVLRLYLHRGFRPWNVSKS